MRDCLEQMEVHAIPAKGWQVTIGIRHDVIHGPYHNGGRPMLRREVEEWLMDEVGSAFFAVRRATRFVGVTFQRETDALLFLLR